MQGTTDREIGGVEYNGAALMQNAPTYASIGNHEVMGRYSETSSLSAQFNDPTTRAYAEDLYEERNNDQDPNNDIAPEDKEQFIEDNSFNTTTWEEVLTLPESETGDERYYAVTIGDVRVIVLEVARIWRNNTVGGTSKYSEIPEAAESQYGFGQHIFEPIGEGSDQLAFLEEELQSDEFQNAKYKMVMFHWQFHSLGGNQIPAYTDPQPSTVGLQDGREMTIYEYPLAEDYLKNNVEPLLEEYNVDFVFNAHSHLWNRFQTDSGMNILETSNNGNTYNAFLDTKSRTDAWPSALNGGDYAYLADNWDKADYPLQGDPYGLSPIMPNVAELPGGEPYLMSNTITAFSVLDTAKGTVDSYYFDTEDPDSEVVLFDSFSIQRDSKENYELAENDVLSKIGSYATGYSDQEGGVAEIVAYNKENEKFYLVNGREQKLDIVSLADLKSSGEQTLSLEKRVDVSAMIEGFSFGDITSVAVDTNHNRIAVAVQAAAYDQAGAILLLDYDGNYIAHYAAGVQPDMVTFSPNGNYVLSANEGEPREGYEGGATDPQGSVTVVDLSAETPAANTIDFTAWDSQRADLLAENVILKQGLNPSTDFEPEYIAVDSASETAYVALQEANAIATLDLASGTFTDISSLGFKNHLLDNNEIDAIKDDSINIKWENLRGVYMPDGIAITETDGKTYLLTANEGDASEWGDYANITEVEINGETVEVLDSSKLEGLPEQSAGAQYILGGRSFSIYEVTANGLEQVYDSGSDFEKITAKAYPDYFNASNKNNNLDSRSDAKGPEPESVAVNQVSNKTYAYIGLERIGGVMLYDITDPTSPVFCDYINSRDFTVDFPDTGTAPEQGDVSVEGMAVVAAKDSPTGYPLLLAANEVSGTVAVYQHNEGRVNQGGGGGSSSSSGNAINSSNTSNGKISISPARAEEGDTVTITVTPDTGYQLDQLTVTDADGNTIRTNNQGDGKYTFTMPDSRVTVKATFSQSNGTETPSTELPFQDVAAGSWYADAVAQAYEEGWMNGTSATAFSPNSEITRGMIVTILHRLEQTPAAEAASFTDVATGSYYADAVAWAAANGIVKGYSESQFGPNDPITREQLATILYNYANHKGYETTASADLSGFGDASQISAYAQTALQWANGAGIINGMADNTLQPQGSATRAEAATMLVRFQSNIAQ